MFVIVADFVHTEHVPGPVMEIEGRRTYDQRPLGLRKVGVLAQIDRRLVVGYRSRRSGCVKGRCKARTGYEMERRNGFGAPTLHAARNSRSVVAVGFGHLRFSGTADAETGFGAPTPRLGTLSVEG